jgi:transcriptional antiterminator NusG
MPWYVIHTYSGHEKKVKSHLEQRIRVESRQDEILEVRIPTQRVTEVRDGKRRTVERNTFPGYVFVNIAGAAAGQEEVWPFIRQTPGVMGFLGSKSTPTPLLEADVPGLMESEEVEETLAVAHVDYASGDAVRVIEGPFTGFTGQVTTVDHQKQKLTLTISIFGRATPVELEFLQVERA